MSNATPVRLLSSDDLPLVLRLLNTSEYIYQRFTLEELPMLLKHYPAVGIFNGDSMHGFLLSQTVNPPSAWLGGFVACNQAQGSAVYQHTQVPDNFVVTTVIPAVRGKGIRAVEDALNIQVAGSPSVFLCGSGPAIGILAAGDPTPAVRAVREAFAQHGIPTTTVEYRPANLGARHWLDLQVPTAELTHSVSKPNLIPV